MLSRIHDVFALGGDRVRSAYRGARAALTPLDTLRRLQLARSAHALEELRIDANVGFLKVRGHQLDHVPEVVQATIDRAAAVAPPGNPARVHLWEGYLDDVQLDLDSPFIRFAMQPDLVDAITEYLGVVPILGSIEVWKAWWTPELWNTQRWHCDWDDVTQVKVYVYASDVPIEAGPTTVLGAPESTDARDRLQYNFRRGHRGHMLDDEEIAEVIDLDRATPLVGARGDVMMVDTSRCFHMGGRMESESSGRLLAIFQYLRPGASTINLDRSRLQLHHLFGRAAALPERERLLLGVW